MRISYKIFREAIEAITHLEPLADKVFFDMHIDSYRFLTVSATVTGEIEELEILIEKQRQTRQDNEGQGDNKAQ